MEEISKSWKASSSSSRQRFGRKMGGFLPRYFGQMCMRAQCMFICSFVCASVHLPRHVHLNHSKNSESVEVNHNHSKHLESYDYVLRTNRLTWKHQFLHPCMLTRYLHLQIFIQILDVLDLHFQDQRFESNTLASSYVKCTRDFVSMYQSPSQGESGGLSIKCERVYVRAHSCVRLIGEPQENGLR